MSKEKSTIAFEIELDANKVPERIEWQASDQPGSNECKAVMLSIWDEKDQNTLRIDLWNKDMQVDEMKRYMHQTLLTLSDTFERATGEKDMANSMREYCEYFAKQMGIMGPIG